MKQNSAIVDREHACTKLTLNTEQQTAWILDTWVRDIYFPWTEADRTGCDLNSEGGAGGGAHRGPGPRLRGDGAGRGRPAGCLWPSVSPQSPVMKGDRPTGPAASATLHSCDRR